MWLYFNKPEYTPVKFKETLLYRWLRHPLMLGFIIAFWATPDMTQGHLLFAVVTTAYILIAIQIEERTLLAIHGEDYRRYQRACFDDHSAASKVGSVKIAPQTKRRTRSRRPRVF